MLIEKGIWTDARHFFKEIISVDDDNNGFFFCTTFYFVSICFNKTFSTTIYCEEF